MKKFSLLILLITLCVAGFAQTASQYLFTESTTSYNSISSSPGVTSTTAITADDDGLQNIPIGFTFVFCGTSYTQFSANSNGWISLANSTTTDGSSAYSNSVTSLGNDAGGQGFLMPFWDDLVGAGYCYYITTGTAPNRVFTFQWADPTTQWSSYGDGSATFQVILYENSGVVQFAYGGSGYSSASATIGIANSSSDYLTLPDYSSSAPNTSFNTGVSASPAANTLMTWTPPPTILVTPSSLTYTNLHSTTSAPQTVTVTGYGFTGTNVTVTPPSNFMVYNGSSYVTTPISLPVSTAAMGTYINTTAQIEFAAPATVGTYTGNATFVSTGATTQNVSLTGNSVNPCSGTPAGGTAAASPASGGGTTAFTLTNSGFTIAAGITFQWQSSADGSTGWTNIPGATTSTYVYSGLSANTYFRCNVTCTNTSITTASSATMLTFIPIPTCTPTSSSYSYGGSSESWDYYYGIGDFNLASATGASLSDDFIYDVNPATGYVSRIASIAPITLYQGGTYAASADFYYTNADQECQVWIDFNDNGTFEASEEVSPVSGFNSGATPSSNTFNVTIPTLASLGTHLMRIRGIWENTSTSLGTAPAHLDPCGLNYMGTDPEYYSGTCADYLVNIQPPPPFGSATPASISFAATVPGSYAASQSFSVSGSYMLPVAGNLIVTSSSTEFEISPDNTTWYTTSFILPYTGAFLTSPVYVRFKPSAVSSYSGNITITGGGIASPISVAVTGLGAAACSGAPSSGAASITPANGSGLTVFTLLLTGYTVAGGVTFQWQSSPDGTTWANIAGATNFTYTFTGISADMSYRAQVTCPFTPSTVSSSTTSAIFTPVPTCVTTSSSWAYGGSAEPYEYDYGVGSFSVTAATGSNLVDNDIITDVNTSTGYLDRTSWAPITLYQNGVYPTVANFGVTSNFQEAQVWIDFNNNGTFETSEEVSPVSGFSTSTTPYPNSFNISIPPTAATGMHLMRVRGIQEVSWTSLYTAPDHLDPCNYEYAGSDPEYYSGTAVDYYVNIQVPPPSLAATPAALVFPATTPSTYSGTQSSALNGIYLVPASGSITVTAPSAAFEISPDHTTWYTTSYTSSYTGATATATVYVRFHPSATGSYSGNISVTGGGLSSPTLIAVSGDGVPACSGTPTAGTAAITPSAGSTGTAFALSLSGYTIAGGISFQWQSSPDGSSSWSDIPGATLASYSFTGIAATEYFRCNVTCSGSTVPSSVTSAVFVPGPGCTPTSSSWTSEGYGGVDYGISSLSVTGFSGSSMSDAGMTSSANSSTGYLDRTGAPVVNLQQSGVYAASADWGSIDAHQEGQIWIDFNDDGIFSVSEEVTPVFGYNVSSTPSPVSFNISIPLTANVGTHLMRVRGIWETFSAGTSLSSHLDPCLIRYGGSSPDYYSGNVVDYWVNIVELPPCTGTPAPGTVAASIVNGCGTSFTTNLSATGTTTGVAALTYQWQSSADGSSYADVSGATNPTYTATVSAATYYRLNVGCTPSGITSSSAGQYITINPNPGAISGSGMVCQGSTTTLIETSSGGTWSSGNPSVAAIGSGSGIVSGITTGTAVISFTLPTGCSAQLVTSVNASPSSSILTPGTAATTCAGTGVDFTATSTFSGSQVLVSQDFNSGMTGTGGTWTTDNSGSDDPTSVYNWAINSTNGWSDIYVSGDGTPFIGTNADEAGFSTLDTKLISPSFSTVGMNAASVSFNHYCNSSYFSDNNVEVDYSTDGGSTWNTLQDYLGNYSGSTSWSAGTPDQVLSLPSDAIGQPNVMVRWYYNSYYGYQWVVDNIVISAVPNITYAWSGVAGASGLSCLDCANPTITPTATGANEYTITASALGCSNATTTVTVNVNPQPEAIAGPAMVCTGSVITMTDATAGGTWSSASAHVTVDAATGEVTGVTSGTADITYSLTSTGCIRTATVTVNDAPAAITGAGSVCNGFTTTLADITPSGVWSSSNTAYATVNGLGVVSGNATGVVAISYTTLNGCTVTAAFTVNAQPASITGSSLICTGATTPLGDATFGGAWSSSTSNASVTGGNVYGVTPGTATISYTVGSCSATLAVTVGQSPAAIGGSAAVCAGASNLLSNSYAGGTWSSSNANAAVDAAGNLTGSAVGNATITYTLPAGCYATVQATVNPAASAIAGTAVVCVNATTHLSNPGAGTWSSSNTAVANINSTGDVTGVSAGMATITFALPSGCYTTQTVTVHAIPASFAMTGGGYFCAGDAGVHVGLAGGQSGVSYQLYQGAAAMGSPVTGSSSTIDFGVFNTEGTYTVLATISSTGCSAAMIGSEDVIANPLPVAYSLMAAGSTTGCLGGAGVVLVTDVSDPGINYQLYNGTTAAGSPVAGTGSDISFGSVYASGVYSAVAIDAVTSCHIDMMGTVNVTISNLPAVHNVTGGGHYCSGGAGSSVGLDGSEAGVTYTLYNGTAMVASMTGTGAAISFGAQTLPGAYTIVAQNAGGCVNNMTGSVSVAIDPLPLPYYVTGGGSLCAGGVGVHIGVSGSNTGINYTLYNGATASATLAGSGLSIDFAPVTASGTYSVLATDATSGCSTAMMGTAPVIVNPLPVAHNVTGSAALCPGSAGSHIGVDGSDPGMSYQLYNGSATVGAAVAGTGSLIDFGAMTAAGAYTVLATDLSNGCTNAQAGSAVITTLSAPAAYAITGGGAYCDGTGGVYIGLASSSDGVKYQLYNGTTAEGAAIAGTSGTAIDFGPWTAPGTYSVLATDTTTGCTSAMTGTAGVSVNSLPTVFAVGGGGNYCTGGTGVDVTLTGSEPAFTYQLYNGAAAVGFAIPGTGAMLHFGLQTAVGTYSVVANPGGACATAMSGSAVVNTYPLPAAHTVTGGGSYCEGGSGVGVSLSAGDAGVQYQLYNGTAAVGAPVTGTGSAINFGLMTAAGTYTVRATDAMTCVNGMTGSATVSITATVSPVVTVAHDPADSLICNGTAVSFYAHPLNGGATPSYQWTVNGAVVGIDSVGYTYAPADGDVVAVTLASSAACATPATATGSDTMTVISNVTPYVSIASDMGNEVCIGTSVTLTSTVHYAGSAPTYRWMKNGIASGVGSTFTFTPADGDVVYFIENSSLTCVTTSEAYSNNIVMTVDPMYVPAVAVVAYPGATIVAGTTDSLVAEVSGAGPAPHYQWYVGATAVPGATNSSFVSSTLNNGDSVSCDVTGSGACQLHGFNMVIILTVPVSVAGVSINDANIRLMPNPNKGDFTIKGTLGADDDQEVALELTDVLGQVVYHNNVMARQGAINEHVTLSNTLANGMYVLSVRSGGNVKVFHMVLEQ